MCDLHKAADALLVYENSASVSGLFVYRRFLRELPKGLKTHFVQKKSIPCYEHANNKLASFGSPAHTHTCMPKKHAYAHTHTNTHIQVLKQSLLQQPAQIFLRLPLVPAVHL